MSAHYFAFSREFRGPDRICGDCGRTYDEGDHLLIDKLKPHTSYVCPGCGHSSIYTGAYRPVMRTLRDHLCGCGAELVEEDSEQWLISFEIQSPGSSGWHPVQRVGSRHSTHEQRDGLLRLIGIGEPVRNVTLTRLYEDAARADR